MRKKNNKQIESIWREFLWVFLERWVLGLEKWDICRVSEESKEGEEDVCVVNKLFREAGEREKKVDRGNGKKKEKLDYYYD